jgi:hypothetical protein
LDSSNSILQKKIKWKKSEKGEKKLKKTLVDFFSPKVWVGSSEGYQEISSERLKERLPDYWHFCDDEMKGKY